MKPPVSPRPWRARRFVAGDDQRPDAPRSPRCADLSARRVLPRRGHAWTREGPERHHIVHRRVPRTKDRASQARFAASPGVHRSPSAPPVRAVRSGPGIRTPANSLQVSEPRRLALRPTPPSRSMPLRAVPGGPIAHRPLHIRTIPASRSMCGRNVVRRRVVCGEMRPRAAAWRAAVHVSVSSAHSV